MDDRLVNSTYLGWLQSSLGLRKMFRKTVGMVYNTYWASRVRVDEAYTRRMPGEGQSFKERQR